MTAKTRVKSSLFARGRRLLGRTCFVWHALKLRYDFAGNALHRFTTTVMRKKTVACDRGCRAETNCGETIIPAEHLLVR
ncbi:hypothetical protein OSTOST_17200 [Ostertagia ostertagi]